MCENADIVNCIISAKENVTSCYAKNGSQQGKSKIEEVFCGFACYTPSGAQLDALCDQTTNAPELRNARSKRA